MNAFLTFGFNLSQSVIFGLALWSVIAILVVAFGALTDRLYKSTSGAFRHSIWLSTAACIALTPVATFWIPGLLPQSNSSKSVSERIESSTRSVKPRVERETFESKNDSTVSNADHLVQAQPHSLASIEFNQQNAIASNERRENLYASSNLWNGMVIAILLCWTAGIIVCLRRIFIARFELASIFAKAAEVNAMEPIHDRVFHLVKRLACEEGLQLAGESKFNAIKISISEQDTGPLVWGDLPARILLPASIVGWPTEAQESIVRHELAHVLRKDEWVRRYLLVLRSIFWFHPFVRYCCNQVQFYAEVACDDQVVRKGHLPGAYSKLLLILGRSASRSDALLTLSSMAQSEIGNRITAILKTNASRKPISTKSALVVAIVFFSLTAFATALRPASSIIVQETNNPFAASDKSKIVTQTELKVGIKDWPQWGGSSSRNNAPTGQLIPVEWDVKTGKNIRWSMPTGSSSYGGVVVANGKVYVGTNNDSAYIKRFPKDFDLGVLLCFDEKDGTFLWQHSNRKLPTGSVQDFPNSGVCSAPMVDGDRLWYVSNRCEVVCLDSEGFRDGENDGPVHDEEFTDATDGDIVWRFDMMNELNVSPCNMSNCSVTCAGDLLFVNTSLGDGETHSEDPQIFLPSFICLSKSSGKVLWSDNSPSPNILHGQWSSPAYAILNGVPQVVFGGGDGYVYGFDAAGENGRSKLLWKFDCNPKESLYQHHASTRNHIVATPVIYDGKVFVSVGADPEHGEGKGHLWCIDPTKRGDVSPTLVYNSKMPNEPIAHKRRQAMVKAAGDFEKANPNSAAIWHYEGEDTKSFKKSMHRTCGTVAIAKDLLFVADLSGLFHCLDARSGKCHWTYDMLAACWTSPLIVDGRVYIADEDGDVAIFKLSAIQEEIGIITGGDATYTSPIVANDTLFLSTRHRLFSIQQPSNP